MHNPNHLGLARRLSLATLFAAAPAGAALSGDALRPITRDQLCVTEGHITPGPGETLQVADDKMRAVAPAAMTPTIEARFTYLGPTAETAPLGSGAIRRQLALKLRAQDPCNLVYATWRFEPKPEIVVQVKSNPGENQSSVCHNNGYSTVRPALVRPVTAPAPGEPHRLSAAMRGDSLRVQVDGAAAWQGDVAGGPESGPVGVRSDNVRLEMTLLARVEDRPAGPCPTGPQD